MSKHVPGSSSVCIHSVCISLGHRRQKLGLGLVKEYVSRLSPSDDSKPAPYARILLIAHEELCGFYEKAGFEWVGKSAVMHGAKPWFEMRKVLKPEQPLLVARSSSRPGIPSNPESTQGGSLAAIPTYPHIMQAFADKNNVSRPV